MMEALYLTVLSVTAFLVICFLLLRLFIIKRNLRQMGSELKKARDDSYNRDLTVTLFDRDLEQLAVQINNNLEYQKNLKLQTEKSRKQLEQSISDIAHDLRTPLTVIKGNLQLLGEEELSEKGKAWLDISARKAETLKGMVDEFFELSVLESDTTQAELTRIDIIPFLSEFIIENESIIREKGLTPIISFPDRSVFVYANSSLLNRVMNNLIGNIVKYARGDFELSVIPGGDGTDVIRTGNAVDDPESIDTGRIFDRTYRADKARSDGSAGLGLYIAKLLMQKQNGDIIARIEGDHLYFDLIFGLDH